MNGKANGSNVRPIERSAEPAAGSVRIEWLDHAGLKCRDARYELGDVNGFFGENGAGKSTFLEALHLLARGEAPGVDATADGIMSLARGREITISAALRMPDGRLAQVSRSWKRDRENKVSQKITSTARPAGGNLAEMKSHLHGILGGMHEAWVTSEILEMSASKLRQRLLRILPKAELDVAKLVPGDCPDWAQPKLCDLNAYEWVDYALRMGSEQLSAAHESVRRLSARLDELGDAWSETESIEPLQKQLQELRRDLLDRKARADAESRVLRAENEVNAAREAVAAAGEGPALDLARASAVEASKALSGLSERVKAIAVARGKIQVPLTDRRAKLAKIKDAPIATEGDVEEARAELMRFTEEQATAKAAIERIDAELRRIGASALDTCPHCGGDLRGFVAEEKKKIEQEREIREGESDFLGTAVEEARALIERRKQGVLRSALEVEIDELESQLAGADLDMSGPDADLERARKADDEAQRALKAAETRDRARARLLGAEENLTKARTDLAAIAYVDDGVDKIEADIAAIEKKVEQLGAENERRKQHADATRDYEMAKETVEALKKWMETFKGIQAHVLATTKAWIEERLQDVMQMKVTLELGDVRGNEDCRFVVDGRSAETLSKGERWTFLAALVVVLAAPSDAAFKPLIIDELEHVSLEFREGFVRAVLDAVKSKRVSQAYLAGCPDTLPEVDGVTVFRLGRGQIERIGDSARSAARA